MASNNLAIANATLVSNSTGAATKSTYFGAYPAGVNWVALYTEALKIYLAKTAVYPAARALLQTSISGRLVGDTNNTGSIDLTDVINLLNYSYKALSDASATSWIAEKIDKYINENPSAFLAEGTFYNTSSSSPVVAIFGGSNPSILDSPTSNMSKLFFHTDFDYLRVKSVVDFTITFPDRTKRTSGGGKKGSSNTVSYNGYADEWVYQHNYGSPPPAFTVFIKNEAGNGSLAGLGLTGSMPVQFNSADTFRMALVYSTDQHLVIRERYQVYSTDLTSFSLTCRAFFFENPTSVNAYSGLTILHSPASFNEAAPYTGLNNRVLTNTITFTSLHAGESFDKVEVQRVAGGIPGTIAGTTLTTKYHYINQLNGTDVTEFDSYNVWTTLYTGTPLTTWSMRVFTRHYFTGATTSSYYSPRWLVRFTNTTTGETFTDAIGGIHWFKKQGT